MRKTLGNKIMATALMAAMVVGNIGISGPQVSKAETNMKSASYIVKTEQTEEILQKYGTSDTISDNAANLAEKNDLVSVQMSEDELQEAKGKKQIEFVEEDAMVSACTEEKEAHEKELIVHKTNTKDTEWNMQMIHAEEKTEQPKHKVKVAVLDSGVDYGNDIDLAYTITLVPGEEEMNPLFMDGTGHGNSVAGLIAACDNGEGITGVNPDAEIYSIRVLDNNNQAPLSRVIEGIYTAIDQKVDIINMSFGISKYSEALHQAICDAKNAGILLIAAAGNTGDKGVQYPAAFDEVMAVESVDKSGTVVKNSATGPEVEIVAPGELVKSTGYLGDNLVASGTSLAAPQVAGAASLVWEENPNLSSDQVRNILDASANLYDDKDKYGSGLLDVTCAMSIGNISDGTDNNIRIENNSKIDSFKDTGCVEGSWGKDDHGNMIPSDYVYAHKGARFPDENSKISGMTKHPWWHGYWQKQKDETIRIYTVNYVANYIYITRLANKIGFGTTVTVPTGLVEKAKNEIDDEVKNLQWPEEIRVAKPKQQRSFLWGMAMHSLGDAFAHCAYKMHDGKWTAVTHKGELQGADSKEKEHLERYQDAKKAVDDAMIKYVSSDHPSGTYREFDAAKNAMSHGSSKKNYKMGQLYEFINQVGGNASSYKSVSHTIASY